MKKSLLYLLLFSYTTIVCKPLLPSLSDAIAHIFWYSEHMATVHYEHGKYHVHYEYQQAAKNEYPQKDTNLPKSSDSVSEHLVVIDSYHGFHPALITTYLSIAGAHLLHKNLDSDIPPPKA